ncbi:manganese ion binding protein [Aureococcus anophagefferens]|nr:manganese ion binding protein [Aureococcus anophagefferens]
MKGWQAMDGLETAERVRLAALLALAGLLDQATAAFAAAPRVSDVFLENDADRCVVVGDLHGSLGDLVTACGLAGEPGPSTRIVFNGDFVDRGRDGVEVLGVVLALHLTFPEFVKVNRGNHEDTALSSAYDFEGELTRKYGRRAARRSWSRPALERPVEYPSADFPKTGAPNAARGGAGCVLYDGLLAPWLRREGLVRLVRSHETVATGAKVTDLGGGVERWTVFSASRYPHGTGLNKAAVLALSGDGAAAPSRWDHDRPERPSGPRPSDGPRARTDWPAAPAARGAGGVAAGFARRSRAELRRVLGDDARGFAAFARAVGEVNATLPADRAIDAAAVWALLALADG